MLCVCVLCVLCVCVVCVCVCVCAVCVCAVCVCVSERVHLSSLELSGKFQVFHRTELLCCHGNCSCTRKLIMLC